MKRKRRNNFDDSAFLNNASYFYYYNRLKELAMSAFEWVNVPDTVNIRYLEESLYETGKAAFFQDDVLNAFVALRCAAGGGFNVYGEPINFRAYGYNGYTANLDLENAVIIYNNQLKTPSRDICKLYAYRLYNISRAIDVNANAQKTPLLLKGSESQILTLKNAYMQYDGNMPVMIVDKDLDLSGFTVLKTDAPYVADRLKELHDAIWNEALTYLGICNVAIEKRAQIMRDEVLRSQGGTIASRYSRLTMREIAAQQINDMFGLNIKIKFRDGLSGEDITDIIRGVDNEQIYNAD